MQLCSNNHEEVCYENHTICPVCEEQYKIIKLENRIDDLMRELDKC